MIASATCVNNNDAFLMGIQAVVVPGKGVAACQAGVDNTFIRLEDVGITGNSHMMMMDKNNLQVADVVIQWLADNAKQE